MNKLSVIFISVVCMSLLSACTDYDELPPQLGSVGTAVDGSIIEYLSENDMERGYSYDSLRYLIENIPGMRDSLSADSLTCFVVPNECFSTALRDLNKFRTYYKLGRELCLRDLLIEPFVVVDTIVTLVGIMGGKEMMDTTFVERKFDYRTDLANLLGHYFLKGEYNYESTVEYGGSVTAPALRDGYVMQINGGRTYASGIEQAGSETFSLIDTKDSHVETQWVSADVDTKDLHFGNGYVHIVSKSHVFGFNEMLTLFKDYGNEKKSTEDEK